MFHFLSVNLNETENVLVWCSQLVCNTYCAMTVTDSLHFALFLAFSIGTAMHHSVYSLLEEYIPKNLAILSRDFVSSHISSNCSRFGLGDGFSGVAWLIFHLSMAASDETFDGSGWRASYQSWKHCKNSWNALNVFSGCSLGSKYRREQASSRGVVIITVL